MKTITIFILLSYSCFAWAADFAARVAEAKTAAATPDGKEYETSTYPAIQAAMLTCIPPGTTNPENLGKFTLVTYVTKSGMLSAVEVQPNTKVSQCFSELFAKCQLPTPPSALTNELGYPLEVTMSIAP